MLRLFFAIRMPEAQQQAISMLLGRLRDLPVRVSWVQPANLHFTLKFLGDVPERLLPILQQVGEAVGRCSTPVRGELVGLGAFPNARNPRVIWVGVGAGADTLVTLAATLENTLRAGGLVLGDNKPFAAHCTLGRVKDSRGQVELTTALEREASFMAGWLEVAEMHLIRSELSRSGPTYTDVATFPLQGERA